jgi:hypothetical protein
LIQSKAVAQDQAGEDDLPHATAVNELATDRQQLVISLGMKDLDTVIGLLREISSLEGKDFDEQVLQI